VFSGSEKRFAVLIGCLNLARAVQCRTTIGELANAIAAATVAATGPSCILKATLKAPLSW
jgi:hypothetical protein